MIFEVMLIFMVIFSIILSLIAILKGPKKITIDKTRTGEFRHIVNRVDEVEENTKHFKNYKESTNRHDKSIIKIKKRLLDLEIGNQKPKFKKGDKVMWPLDLGSRRLTRDEHGDLTYKTFGTGEYVCREIDYEKGYWIAKVLDGCEIEKIPESCLTKKKK